MLRGLAIVTCLLFSSALVQAKTKHCTLRIHAETNANDSATFAQPVVLPLSQKSTFVTKSPALFEGNVVAFRAYQAPDGSYGALIQFDDHGRLILDSLSIEHRGTSLLVMVNGRAVTELAVDKRVADGRIYIPSGLTGGDIALMAKDWKKIGPKKK
ncbi:MAG: hypothetical protein M3R59_09525 [Verrucomicrobiota bacterium]|nr:hypothetical protein [Verrucomicrobiota bacterium]